MPGTGLNVRIRSPIDPIVAAVPVIESVHSEIHKGEMYFGSVFEAALADDGVLSFSTPDPIGAAVHFTFAAACGGDAEVELLEGHTVSGGDAITIRNMKRDKADSGLAALKDTTIGGTPVTLAHVSLPGGSGPHAGGGSVGSRANMEWITDAAKSYAIRVTNRSGGNAATSIVVNFYT
jgi:hypothetical protein